jgi:RNA polymerase I-specific transcription initiation factor RRN3
MDAYTTEASARNARRYLGTDSSNGEQADRVSIHALFYTICQASFYIMCFRGKECIDYHKKAIAYHKDLVDQQQYDHDDIDDDDDDMMLEYSDPQLIDITAETWDRVCTHHLNPLKFCLESVRGEFLHLAENFDLLKQNVLDKLIIEDGKMASLAAAAAASSVASATTPNEKKKMMRKKKKRRRASCIQTAATLQKRRLVGGVGGLGKGSNPLDSFFPFDPYLLRRSYVFVHSYYRQWDSSSIVNDKKDDEEEEVKEVDEVDDVHDDDYYDITSIDDSQSDGFEEDEEEEIADVQSDDEHYDEQYDKHGSTAMSLMSTTASMGGSEWTDDLSDTELDGIDNSNHRNGRVSLVPAVNELKRARSLSMADDCW